MTPQELEKLKEDLLAEKDTIEAELNRFAVKNPQVKDDYQAVFHQTDQTDTNDEKAHSVTDFEEERAVEQSLEVRLKEINETIRKIDDGKYGVCSKCQIKIDENRLRATPAALFCVGCAKAARFL